MKNKLQTKLRQCCGESIAEVLVALLISTLALMMLAGMISATQSMVESSDTTLNKYYAMNGGIATPASSASYSGGTASISSRSITINVTESGSSGSSFSYSGSATCYINDTIGGKPVIAYYAGG